MIPEAEVVEFVNEMSRTTGVLVSFGVNAYYVDPEPGTAFVVFIDPAYLDGVAVSKMEAYAERKGLNVVEEWSDWGRFLKIMKLRTEFVSAFSP
ncbi:MAG: hypothetical protein ABSA11_15655 [Candidatus Bathyarchaeia archaeon]